ncbi:surface lipoprotein assembly modifier [Litoreibacter janthinus]|uniref:surface lipoprotein assembly modifier n=1 Tax=Litoreibacter janthinus TaxID=670154 RepID=UPI001114572B|nr:surface lipoprotein assembly modifier [Litoreibacter janthinus]
MAQTAPTVVSVADSRTLAFNLVSRGQPTPARAIANTLLERNPNDIKALLVLSRAERLLGDLPAAKQAGKRAWRAADAPEDRYTAAMLTAQAISSSGNKIGAQIWLRRAAQVAPNDQLKATAVRDLRYVRGTSPVALSFDLSVAPSSNINNGSKSDTIEVFGLPFALSGDLQALSGVEYSLGATLSYKLPAVGTWTLTAGANVESKHYTLSSSAKAIAPTVSGSDYAFQQLQVSLAANRTDADRKASTSLYVKAGQNWYGGSTLTRFAGVGAARQYQIGERSSLQVNLGAERQWRQDNAQRSADVVTLSSTWGHGLTNGSAIWVTGFVRDTASESSSIAQETAGASLNYSHGKPIFADTKLELSIGYENKRFDRAQFPFVRREDQTVSASATMIFSNLDYMGFAPTAELSAKRTSSTLGQYSNDDLGLKLGLRSTF